MIAVMSPRLALCTIMVILLPGSLNGQEQPPNADGLTPFSSEAGKFSIRLPGKPRYEATTVGDAKEVQHQYQVTGQQGVYLISHQENPNLRGGAPKDLQAALQIGRDGMQKAFRGEVLESKDTTLDGKHPGLSFRLTIPQAGGEARCRFYMVGTRLYQILAIGTPEFVSSDQSTRILASFKLLP